LNRRLFPLLFITLLTGLPGCATNPVTGKQDFVLMSVAEEIDLGQKYHLQIEKETPPYADPRLAAYVDQVGQRLARVSDRPQLHFHFTVLDSKQVNAFALPGGYIYINRGLLAYLNSEAELAAVLGHEIGHVTARHSVRQQSVATVTGLAGAALKSFTGVNAADKLFNVLAKASLSGYGRRHELEADRLSARYLARAGYDPQAMVKVIGVLKNQELFEKQRARKEGRKPHAYHGVFASHPDNDRRLQEVVGEASHVKVNRRPHIARADFLHHLDGLAFGDSEAGGIALKGRFLDNPLNFGLTFPDDWSIENLPDRLVLIAPQSKAYMEVRVEKQDSHPIPYLYLQQKGFKALRNVRTITIANRQAYTATTWLNTKFGQRTARLTVIYDAKLAYLFIGFSQEETDQVRFDSAFQKIADSFHALTAKEKKRAKGLHIELVTATPRTRLTTLAQHSPIPDYAESQLRILNNLYPAGELVDGQKLKVVR